jgi:hypothetical protein
MSRLLLRLYSDLEPIIQADEEEFQLLFLKLSIAQSVDPADERDAMEARDACCFFIRVNNLSFADCCAMTADAAISKQPVMIFFMGLICTLKVNKKQFRFQPMNIL